jgi:multicomponent Na+:H+ antiporter subunit G
LTDLLAGLLIVIGTFFIAAGSIGLIRFPDVLCRMHATTKTTTLGACSIFLAATLKYGHSPIGLKSLLAVAFLLLGPRRRPHDRSGRLPGSGPSGDSPDGGR